MGFKLNLHLNKAKVAAKQVADDIDIASFQKSLLEKNASQLDFTAQFQKLFTDISNAISTELFNSQYKETQTLKALKQLQEKSSKAKSIDEVNSIRKSFEAIISPKNTTKSIEAGQQLGINALIKKK